MFSLFQLFNQRCPNTVGSFTTSRYLRETGVWDNPPNTTYSAGTGLSLSGNQFSVNSGYIVNLIYPVGSIYMSVSSANPGTLFTGTTWVAWGMGRVPLGIGSAQANTTTAFGGDTTSTGMVYRTTVEEKGGEVTHTLTTSEMPKHSHDVLGTGSTTSGSGGAYNVSRSVVIGQTEETGENQTHNNMPLYITCYMWKRTA